MNNFSGQEWVYSATGRPATAPAWGLLTESMTGYDWHGGFYAAPQASAPTRRTGRREAAELKHLSARDRRDAGLPVNPPQRRRLSLGDRMAAWGYTLVPGAVVDTIAMRRG